MMLAQFHFKPGLSVRASGFRLPWSLPSTIARRAFAVVPLQKYADRQPYFHPDLIRDTSGRSGEPLRTKGGLAFSAIGISSGLAINRPEPCQ